MTRTAVATADADRPRNTELDRIAALPLADRAEAARQYVERHRAAMEAGQRVRDDAVVDLSDQYGPTQAARIAGLSLSRVKQLRWAVQRAQGTAGR